MNVLSLFDGMSCGQLALNKANIKYDKYYASEIDKYAIDIARKNYPNTIHLGDIQNVKGEDFIYDIDLIFGGSPCQSFSFAGKQQNFDDPRGKLFYEFARLLIELKPKYFLLENVRMKQEYQDVISKTLSDIYPETQLGNLFGIEPYAINSDLFIHQNRPRLYWTNIQIPTLPKRPNWKKSYFQWRRSYFRENKSGVCPTLTAAMGMGGHNVPLKSKNKAEISTYRLILSSIKDLDIANRSGPNKKDTDDEDIKKLLKKMVKQRGESIDIYKKNNRADLLEVEQNELDILSGFLPKQLGEDETKKICSEIISKVGASSLKDMGKVMGELKKQHADEIDFAKAGPLIKELLN